MIDKIKKELCTGCKSCSNSCPLDCIDMLNDQEGFFYPKVNDKCNKCGICISKCPNLNKQDNNNFKKPDVYAAWSKNENTRYYSTSGGIFTELANVILDKGGYVVGAQYNKEFLVEHVVIDSVKELHKLRQSKYLQSDINSIYKKVFNLLENNKTVLFCGTPCQIAGINRYLGKEYPNLVKCDFICRGVISPLVYRKYLDMLESKYRQLISNVMFKNKSRGWNGFCTLVEFQNGEQYIENRNNDLYMQGYLKYNMYLRPSCHNCMYKELPRKSDVTLGDFWGIGRSRPYLDEDKGTSVVLLNSNKGRLIFNDILHKIICEKCTIEEVEKGNACLLESVKVGEFREKFFTELINKPFDEAFFHSIRKI